ncbi:phytoene desaturase family protein [Deinococcus radiophilus]|uniref:Pyridine nucleotide-disulfide oxidoreductase domain-containing protein 2 n=1 Tax=Deinococcus radiophilus TaxID=32062 RepID=A0A431VWB6_9DEIO|nr:NAD(P)/FAD-dependent oxidoreductase [Deinococcus radiophilus]RTR27528.1 NAD(P)/FAD-dependent oxidoreductase [Deinococcus radiophilus]UFA50401.1 NAD(P)/FAD-dependent oxidoreductase [Deinococcus radiophilus]
MPDYDLIVMGAGHNALITAAYAARAGLKVGVFERRHMVGGAVSTEELVPGYRFDYGGSAHILIRLTPVVRELELSRFGLHYLELDPLFHAYDGEGQPWYVWRDPERTAAELDTLFPGQGEAYRRFLRDWTPFAEAVSDLFMQSPGPLELGRMGMKATGKGQNAARNLARILRPYGEVAREYFSEERVSAPLSWMAAQSGPPPSDPLSAPFLLWHPLYHKGGVARPKGGSGGLTKALARAIEAYGGEVHVNAPVQDILVEGGRAAGVRLESGEVYTARAVASGAHINWTAKALPAEYVPQAARDVRVGNGFGLILRLALDGQVQYRHGQDEGRTGLGLLIKDERQLMKGYGEYLAGEPTRDPPIIAMSFSAVDDSLAPPGSDVLWLWAQYYPYELAQGNWTERTAEARDSVLNAFEHYAPGTRERIVGELVQTPEWLAQHLHLPRGNVMHLEMTMDQMFSLRPWLGAGMYRWPGLKNMYLTGASTHPGGGIMGASGRNAARVIVAELTRRGWR